MEPTLSGDGKSPSLIIDDLCGTTLPGGFRLDAVLACGGFGTVYRAKQLTVDRDVAVKVMHAGVDPASPGGQLFVHEIRSVGRIDHQNVVRVYHADLTVEGRLFFAMELLAGHDLEYFIENEGTIASSRAVALVRQLVAGLGAAHEANIVHADIKPANVLICNRSGVRKLGSSRSVVSS
jgi:eukaryotic-like serine/threonine-protein kinase